jgi:predicted O-methyltransferase YrrM
MLPIILETQIRTELALPPNKVLLEGWVTPEQGVHMAELVVEVKPDVIVEIGVFGGRSLIAQALALRDNGKGFIYGIDPWKTEATLEGENDENKKWWSTVDMHSIHKGCMEAVWRLNLDKRVRIIRGASQDVTVIFRQKETRPDILFIDGNHSEISSCRDVQLYLPLLRPNGFLWLDDATWPSTQMAIGMVEKDCILRKDYGSYRLYQKKP